MNTKEVWKERTVTAADFSNVLCALAKEELIGLVKTTGEGEFIFSLPGGVKSFRVRVIEE